MNVGVVTFPGSNCDADARYACAVASKRHGLEAEIHQLWHKQHSLPPDLDLIILPGGFSYGDYLRTGAIARFSPIMQCVTEFASAGGLVLGICNGFQILCEAGLLPGALIVNAGLSFKCTEVFIQPQRYDTPFTCAISANHSPLRIPIAHGEGRYIAPPDEIDALERDGFVVFRYVDENGNPTAKANPNGSMNNIAGIINQGGNVMGMMPHPERAIDGILGSRDGQLIFDSILQSLRDRSGSAVSLEQYSE